MHSTQLLGALALALSAFSVAQAAVPDVNVQAAMEHQLVKRQLGTASTSASTPSSSSAPRPQSSSTSKTTPPPTTTPTSTTSQSSTTPPTSPPSTSNTPPPTSTVPSETSAPQTSPTNTDKTPAETSSSLPPPTTSHFTATIVTTDPANGQVSTFTSEGTTVHTPGLASNSNGNNGPPSGLSDQNRNIIIGCVVGVGGAIILAVVGIVAWRVWGRKKNEETDGAFGTNYSPAEKPEQPGSQSSRTPFQSTLESYHAPTQVNTASNF